jgi:hypothetical protein
MINSYFFLHTGKRIAVGLFIAFFVYTCLCAFNFFYMFNLHTLQAIISIFTFTIFSLGVFYSSNRASKFLFYRNTFTLLPITIMLTVILLPTVVLILQMTSKVTGRYVSAGRVAEKREFDVFVAPLGPRALSRYHVNLLVVESADGRQEKFNLADNPQDWTQIKLGQPIAVEYFSLIHDRWVKVVSR